EDRPEVNLLPWERLGIALGLRYKVGESSTAAAARPAGGLRADHGMRLLRPHRELQLVLTHNDEQSQRQLLASRVNTLFKDRRGHAHTCLLMETEARMSREAWGKSMDTSDLACAEVMSLRTTVHAQMSEITELQSADRSRRRTLQREMIPLQGLVTTLQGQVTALQGQVMALQEQVTALQGQQGPVGGPAQPKLPEETGSSS
ncbi:hypothetical protein Tco_0177091, partial [Tanacetum coccineum]